VLSSTRPAQLHGSSVSAPAYARPLDCQAHATDATLENQALGRACNAERCQAETAPLAASKCAPLRMLAISEACTSGACRAYSGTEFASHGERASLLRRAVSLCRQHSRAASARMAHRMPRYVRTHPRRVRRSPPRVQDATSCKTEAPDPDTR